MAANSTMLPLGTKAPDFELLNPVTGNKLSLRTLKSDQATVVIFMCNHCPYVKHIEKKLIEVAQSYQKRGVSFIAINSNDIEMYSEDSPENMAKVATQHQYTFPYLFDETQEIAKAYQAACTPDFYIFDKNMLLVYRGRFDDATPGNNKIVTGFELTQALDNLLQEKLIDQNQQPSIGCSIKWKKNESYDQQKDLLTR